MSKTNYVQAVEKPTLRLRLTLTWHLIKGFFRALFRRRTKAPAGLLDAVVPRKEKVEILEVLRTCPGGLHSWVHTNIGIIRKHNNNIPDSLFCGSRDDRHNTGDVQEVTPA